MMRLSTLYFSFLFISFFLIGELTAQQRPGNIPQNMDPAALQGQIGSVRVDDLPDAQIRLLMERMRESGVSEQQFFAGLQARGMQASEIQKLRERMNKLRAATPGRTTSPTGQVRTREKPVVDDDALFEFLQEDYEDFQKKQVTERQKRIFGYNLFNAELLNFEPSMNVATPKDYTIGPGDEVIIDVWGASEQTYTEVVSPDGYIRIPNLGPIYLSGLQMDRAEDRIKSQLTRIYSGLSGAKPNTFAQVSLGQVRTIKVSVVGEVNRPGTYDVSSLASVFNALYLSGGPTENGSFREIDLIRGNRIHITLDLYDFLVNGVQENNIRLQDQDIIRVKPYLRRIEIEGEVKREGIFEARENDSFENLIEYAGGLTENAYQSRLKVRRNAGGQRKFIDLAAADWQLHTVQNGDVIIVEGITNRFENRVQIRGAVYREGSYELNEGLTLMGLIEKSDGLRGDAFMERGTLFRTNPDLSTRAISFGLREIMKGEAADIPLQREDLISIPSIYDVQEEYFVSIFGEVRRPRTYAYHQEMRIEDLIIKAGGLLESASGARVEVARRVKKEGEQPVSEMAEVFTFNIDKNLALAGSLDFALKPFDQVFIRRSPSYQEQELVKVEGEAVFPGKYTLAKKNERISELLRRAGGVTPEGYPKGATLIRRTEYNPVPAPRLQQLESLMKIREDLEEHLRDKNFLDATESELLMFGRLEEVNRKIQKIREEEGIENQREGIRFRRQQMEALARKDSLIDEEEIKVQEFENIGINLERIMQSPGSKYDLILEDGDVIYIPRKLETVRMRGEFLYPVTVRYDENYTFSQYMSRAGGITDRGRKGRAYVVYANGSVDRTRKFLFFNVYPRVEPGAEVIMPAKPERERLSAQGWIGLSTGLATLALIINNLAQ